MSGTRLAAALVVILLLTFVVPPLAARYVHQQRIATAEGEVARIADALTAEMRETNPGRVLHGSGEVPRFTPEVTWLTGVREEPLPGLGHPIGPDPWGNRYYATVTGETRAVVVLSAGPNGIVETTISAASETQRPPGSARSEMPEERRSGKPAAAGHVQIGGDDIVAVR